MSFDGVSKKMPRPHGAPPRPTIGRSPGYLPSHRWGRTSGRGVGRRRTGLSESLTDCEWGGRNTGKLRRSCALIGGAPHIVYRRPLAIRRAPAAGPLAAAARVAPGFG